MNILFIPNNIASMTAITVDAINDTGKHKARGIIFTMHTPQASHNQLKVIVFRKNSVTKYFRLIQWYYYFLRGLLWCDIVHWNGSFSMPLLRVTLPVIKLFRKPGVVEFVGGERNPEIEFLDNEFYKKAFYSGYEYPYESKKNSESLQELFSKAEFSGLALPGLIQHFSTKYFSKIYRCFQRINILEFKESFPDPSKKIPLIVHAPTAPITKGTPVILSVINELKSEMDFEFRLVEKLPHKEAKALIADADIFIDQIVLGHYGMASMESMAFGKPTFCFIKDFVVKNEFPPELPIINVNENNLKDVLRKFISDGALRHEAGMRSRDYCIRYHDVKNVIPVLLSIYEKEIIRRNHLLKK